LAIIPRPRKCSTSPYSYCKGVCCGVCHAKKKRKQAFSKKALAYAVRSLSGCFCVQDLVNLFLIYQVYSGERRTCVFYFYKKEKKRRKRRYSRFSGLRRFFRIDRCVFFKNWCFISKKPYLCSVFHNTRLTYTATVKLDDEPGQEQYAYTAKGIFHPLREGLGEATTTTPMAKSSAPL
jgi:hypothetical protein